MNDVPVKFGKRVVSETYFDGKLHSIEVSQTESIDASSTLNAQEIAVEKTMDLIRGGIAKRNIDVKYDIDDKLHEIKRVHITHIVHKQEIRVKTK